MEQTQSIGELLGLVRRNLITFIGIVGLGSALAVAYALNKPSIYETSAKVLIESQQIPDELARSTVNLSTAARLQLIQQRLMARDSVAALIERLGLFADLKALSMTRKVGLLRDSTRIESISTPGNAWNQDAGVVAFTITVSLGDAEQAALVANELARSAIAQNLEVRSARAEETLSYFEQEEQRIGDALAEAEAEIAAFKKANEAALPENLEPGRAALARLEAAAIDLDRQMIELELRRSDLEAALSGGASVAGLNGLGPVESELQRLELELATRRRVLGPNHPELRQLQEQLDAVRSLVAADSAADEGGAAGGGGLGQRASSLRHQLDQINARMDQLAARQQELSNQRASLGASLIRDPEVEAALHALERQLAQLRERYADVARRQDEARTGAQLEVNRQSERFEILEPALTPEYPVGPNRKKIVVFGAAASGGLAVGLVFLLQMLRPSIRTSAQMERELALRPIVAVPYVAIPGERRRRVALWASGIVVLAAGIWLAAPLIDRHVVPLAPLKARIEQRLNVGPMLGRRVEAGGDAAAPAAVR